MVRNAIAGMGLTVALGVGVGYAVHEVGELNTEASRIEACVEYNNEHEIPNEACGPRPLSIAEADTLRDTADTTGLLGWIAFFGTLSVGGATLDQIRRGED